VMDQEESEAIKQPTAGFCHATKFIRLNFLGGLGGAFTLQNLSHAVTVPAASYGAVKPLAAIGYAHHMTSHYETFRIFVHVGET
jgi:hypothetical protein